MIGSKLLVMICALTLLQLGCSSLPATFRYSVKKNVVFQKVGGTDLTIDIYKPTAAKRVPIVLVIHGGGWRSRSGNMAGICKTLAGQGFLAFNTTYRLSPAHVYPAAVDDVRSALAYIRANADALGGDKERIYVWGYSAGGHLALLVGLTSGSEIKGIVAGAAPSNFSAYPNSPLIRGFIGRSNEDAANLWAEASPINHVTPQAPPVFMYHGRGDMLVGVELTRAMKAKLTENKVRAETYEVGWPLGHFGVYLFSQASIAKGVEFLKSLSNGPDLSQKDASQDKRQ